MKLSEYQGIVKITSDRIQNGIVISESHILTTNVGPCEIEFFGNGRRFKSRGIPAKNDLTSGLCLLQYSKPTGIQNDVKIYKPSRKGFYRVDVIGWSSRLAIYEFAGIVASSKMEVSPNVEMNGFAVLANDELVGIQVDKWGRFISCLWYDDIMKFIGE